MDGEAPRIAFRDETRDTTFVVTAQTPALFTPLAMRAVTVRNRLVQAPIVAAPGAGGISDWHYAHLGKFAMGGVGLVCLEDEAAPLDAAQGAALAKLARYLQALGARVAIALAPAGRDRAALLAAARFADAAGVDAILLDTDANAPLPPIEALRRQWPEGKPILALGARGPGVDEVRVAMRHDPIPEEAASAVASGQADLVAVGRELLWNPYWAARAARTLGADPDFRTLPTQYGWWLDRRVKTGYEKEL